MPGSSRGPGEQLFPHACVPLFGVDQRTCLGIAVKATCQLSTGAALPRESQEEVQLVDALDSRGMLQTPADITPERSGTSIAVRASVRAETREVSIEVGHLVGHFRHFPDRHWARNEDQWTILESEGDATAHELSWAGAYGGACGTIVWEANPLGVGFVLETGRAEGVALPWLEETGAELKHPSGRPPATLPSFLPAHWADRRSFFAFDDETRGRALCWPRDLDGRFFDVVPQRWVHRPFLRGGEVIRLTGLALHTAMSGGTPSWSGVVPRRAFRLLYGKRTIPLELAILRLEPEQDKAVMTFAATVPYPLFQDAPPIQIVEKRIVDRVRPGDR